MPLTTLLPWIMAAIVASIAAMVTGVASDLPIFSGTAAALFAAALFATAVDVNRPWWGGAPLAPAEDDVLVVAAVRNARLLALGYFWGALALLSVYRLTALRWQHGLQYGAGMALLGWLALLYVHFVVRPGSRLRSPRALALATWLSLAHGGAALGGVLFLLVSGKINSIKDDWAANQIFLAGGVALVGLSLISAYTQLCLSRRSVGGTTAQSTSAEPG